MVAPPAPSVEVSGCLSLLARGVCVSRRVGIGRWAGMNDEGSKGTLAPGPCRHHGSPSRVRQAMDGA